MDTNSSYNRNIRYTQGSSANSNTVMVEKDI